MTIYDFCPDIESNPIFRQTNPTVVNRYLNETSMTIDDFAPHQVAYSAASGNVRVGILLAGIAQAHTGSNHSGEHTLLRTLHTGDMFGIANLYAEEEPFPSLIVATEPCRILFIRGNALKNFIEKDPRALRNYLSVQSKKIVYLNRKITTFAAGRAEKKLAVFLLDHEINNVFTPPCSMSQLAAMLGMGRASLYRAIDSLVSYGFVEKQEKCLLIRNKNELLHFI